VTFDPYQVLGVDRDVAPAIRRAYRRKAKQAHPDAGGSADAFSRLTKAHLVLSDPVRRSRYDRDGTVDDSAALQMHAASTREPLAAIDSQVADLSWRAGGARWLRLRCR
jgi:curved DNA-binding protein CbpA